MLTLIQLFERIQIKKNYGNRCLKYLNNNNKNFTLYLNCVQFSGLRI